MKTLPTLNAIHNIKPMVILDRDGVINFDSDEYIKHPDEWHPIPGSIEAIARLKKAGVIVCIATNQSGISRGYFNDETLHAMHQKLAKMLDEHGAHIDHIEYCPDHPEDPGFDRKPSPGMPLRLMDRFNVIPLDVYFVGDSMSDLQCAKNAGCNPVLVKTGKGERTLAKGGLANEVPVFDDLAQFVDNLLSS